MNYWLMKSEPNVWSIDQQRKAGPNGAPWDGVRNFKKIVGQRLFLLWFWFRS